MLKSKETESGGFITEVDGEGDKGPGGSTLIDVETLLEVLFGGLSGLELFS
jgi:hypothetical protein